MHPILIKIFDFPIHAYGVLIVTGFICALYVAWREAMRQGDGFQDDVLDFAFWGLLGGMAGARLVFIMVNWREYGADPIRILKFWNGGFVFYGAAIGGFLGFVLYARSKKYDLLTSLNVADLIIIGLPLAHVFGRFGCMAAGCCWGDAMFHVGDAGEVISNIPLAAQFPTGSLAYNSLIQAADPSTAALMRELGSTVPLFPSQLAEAFGEGIIFLILMTLRTRKWFHGQILLSYAMLYPILRFTLEFFRGDAARGLAVLSTSQWISILVASASLIAIFVLKKRGIAKIA